MSSRVPPTAAASLAFDGGSLCVTLAVARAGGDAVVEAFVGDHLIGAAPLLPGGGKKRLSAASIDLIDFPLVAFPAQLRLMQDGRVLSAEARFEDAEALLRAVGPPILAASLDGATGEAVTFAVEVDRVHLYPRLFAMLADGVEVATAVSTPDAGAPHRVTFAAALRPGQALAVRCVSTRAISPVLMVRMDDVLAGALTQIARLETRLDAAVQEVASLRRRLDGAVALSRDRMLLDRLDLFYLMLNERIDREMRVLGAPPPASPRAAPAVVAFSPGEVEGVGLFDPETNAVSEWRWFGPDVTLVFRDVGAPVSRIVLNFFTFGQIEGEQSVRVSLAGTTIGAELRRLPEGPWLLEIPVRRAAGWPDGAVIVHLQFARHHTSAADPRLLSAVFSGAELFTLADSQA